MARGVASARDVAKGDRRVVAREPKAAAETGAATAPAREIAASVATIAPTGGGAKIDEMIGAGDRTERIEAAGEAAMTAEGEAATAASATIVRIRDARATARNGWRRRRQNRICRRI